MTEPKHLTKKLVLDKFKEAYTACSESDKLNDRKGKDRVCPPKGKSAKFNNLINTKKVKKVVFDSIKEDYQTFVKEYLGEEALKDLTLNEDDEIKLKEDKPKKPRGRKAKADLLKEVEKQINVEEKAKAKEVFQGNSSDETNEAPDAFDLWKEKAITVNRSSQPEERITRVDELEDFQPVQKTTSRRGYKSFLEKKNDEPKATDAKPKATEVNEFIDGDLPRSKEQQEMLDVLRSVGGLAKTMSVPIARDDIKQAPESLGQRYSIELKDIDLDNYDLSKLSFAQMRDLIEQLTDKVKLTRDKKKKAQLADQLHKLDSLAYL